MADFNFAPTAQGKVLFSDVQAGAVLIPTRFVIGTGSMPAGKETGDMSGVVEPLKSLEVTKRTRTPDGFCIFGCVFTNEDITESFYMRELSLYARAEYRDSNGTVTKSVPEVCLIYGNSGDTADHYPAYSSETVVERNFDIVSHVGADAQVELTIPSGTYLAFGADGNVSVHNGRIVDLVNPVNQGDAIPFGFAEKRYGGPANILVNSNFINPVNQQGQAYYSALGETIDRWVLYNGNVSVGVESGYLDLRTYETTGEFYQPIDPAALVVGNTYTAVAWLNNGVANVQHVTVGENEMAMSGDPYNGFEFAISTIYNRSGLFIYLDTQTTAKVKHIALYEGTYAAENIPEYRAIGYTKELALCNSPVESIEYPGCFYRMVGNEKEWLNPPMMIGEEYRTTRRMGGCVVYVKNLQFDQLAEQGNYVTAVYCAKGTTRREAYGYLTYSTGKSSNFPAITSKGTIRATLNISEFSVIINSIDDCSGSQAEVTVYYTKD